MGEEETFFLLFDDPDFIIIEERGLFTNTIHHAWLIWKEPQYDEEWRNW